MRKHTRELGAASCKLIYDPAFQIILLTGEDLIEGIDGAWAVIGNDYEFAMMERKTGLTIDAIAERCELVIVTYGEQGLRAAHKRLQRPRARRADVAGSRTRPAQAMPTGRD